MVKVQEAQAIVLAVADGANCALARTFVSWRHAICLAILDRLFGTRDVDIAL